MDSTYKVYYFPGNGRAANLRAMLTYSNANWENILVQFSEWPELKKTGRFEFGQMPGLEINGKMYSQTIAIEILLARKLELMGSNAEEEYQIISLIASREDIGPKLRPLMFPNEEEKTRKDEILKNVIEVDLPFFLTIFEKRFETTGGKYFIGGKISLADFFIATTFKSFMKIASEAVTKYAPKLAAHVETLSNGDLAKYFKDVHLNDSPF